MSSSVTHGHPSIWLLRIEASHEVHLDLHDLAHATADAFAEIMRIVSSELGGPYRRCFDDFLSSWTLNNEGELSSSFRIHDLVFQRQHFGGYRDAAPYMILRITKLSGDTPMVVEIGLPMHYDEVYESRVAVLSICSPQPGQLVLNSALVQILLRTLRASYIEGPYSHPLVEPSHTLQMFLDHEYARTVNRVSVVLEGIEKDMDRQVRGVKALAAKQQRKLLRQFEQTATQLETARAVTARERSKVAFAERALREMRVQQASPIGSNSALAVQEDQSQALRETVDDLEVRLKQMRDERDVARQEVFTLQLRLNCVDPADDASASPNVTDPSSIDQVAEWAENALDGERILLHTRAVRLAKKSTFRDAPLVGRVLRALADCYWPMKMEGDAEAGLAWAEFLEAERLTSGPTGAAVSDHRTAESYRVRYDGRQVPLDMHVAGSDSRRPEDCLRVYFHADKMTRRIIIGHYPSHLKNTLS